MEAEVGRTGVDGFAIRCMTLCHSAAVVFYIFALNNHLFKYLMNEYQEIIALNKLE